MYLRLVLMPVIIALAACGGDRLIEEPERRGQVLRGKQAGMWYYHHPDGARKAAGSFAGDQQEGLWTWWYANGQEQFHGQYRRGMRSGTWRQHHDNGVLASVGAYRADRQVGEWSYFDRAGRPFARGAFDAGIKHGPWQWWGPEGALAQAGRYHQGLRVGTWTTWNADGSLRSREDVGVPQAMTAAAVIPAADQRSLERAPISASAAMSATAPVGAASAMADASAPSSLAIQNVAPIAAAVPASDAQFDQPVQPSASAPALSPQPLLPRLWTAAQESSAAGWLARYGRAMVQPVTGYDAMEEPPAQQSPLLGKPLPQTRFLGADGGIIDLVSYRGKQSVVLVVMRGFSGQVCLYCAAQTAALSDGIARFREAGAEVVVIYPGPVESVPAFVDAVQSLRAEPPPMPLALDVSLLLVRSLGIEANLAKPTSLVIDQAGVVRFAHVGTTIADRPTVPDLLAAVRAAGR